VIASSSVPSSGRTLIPTGRKSGGHVTIYSVIETCKLNGVEPQGYIADVIEKIATGWPASRWDELMPWNWQPADQIVAEAA